MNPSIARHILSEGCAILDRLGVRYWLSAGTALGAYRDQLSDEFLTRDTDLDVGVLYQSHLHTIIKNYFEKNRFSVLRSYAIGQYPAQLAMIKKDIIFDIYFFVEEGEKLVNYNEYGKMIKPIKLINNMDTVLGYPVPSPIENYLAIRYGKDWRTPKPKCDWKDQCANLVK